jgi:hypothetical protein
VIAVEQQGHGRTGDRETPITLESMRADTLGVWRRSASRGRSRRRTWRPRARAREPQVRADPEGGQAEQCGWLRDRFGLIWQIVPRRLDEFLADPDRAKARRVATAMLGMVKLDVAALERAAAGDTVTKEETRG